MALFAPRGVLRGIAVMEKQYITLKKALSVLILLLFCAASVVAGDKGVTEVVKLQNETLTIQASKTPLSMILNEIKTKCRVNIAGLESRKDENVTYFSKEGSVESVIKDFLRHLGEKNYAFEYSNEKLLRVAVLPWGKTENIR
jgi:hypothetical protein